MKNKIMFARVGEEDYTLLKKVCAARGENLSSFVRRAVRMELGRLSFLSDDEKKALGLSITCKNGGDTNEN
jgi:hypothetical protein